MSTLSKYIIGLLFIALMIGACGDNEEANLDLTFQLQFDGEGVYSGQEIDYDLGYKVFFTKYSLYLSDIVLESAEGDFALSEVEFVNLLDGITSEAEAERGTSLSYTEVPKRDYTGIRMNIGLPTDVNATSPADYMSTSPLANTGEYWEGWSSYIFHKIEGKIDDPATPEAFQTGLALHIGSDDAFRAVQISTPITITDDNESVNLILDLKQGLTIDGSLYDLLARPQVHHQGVLPEVLPILDATSQAVTIKN